MLFLAIRGPRRPRCPTPDRPQARTYAPNYSACLAVLQNRPSFCGVFYKGLGCFDGTADGGGADGDGNDDGVGDHGTLANVGDDDDGAVGTESGPAMNTATPRRRRKISDSDNDESDDEDDNIRTASASAAPATSDAQPAHAPPWADSDDDDGAVAEGQPALITSLLPVGMTTDVNIYGQRCKATITGHTPNGDVMFSVLGSGIWRKRHEIRPPGFFGIGPSISHDADTDIDLSKEADPSASGAADGATATAAVSHRSPSTTRVWRGATMAVISTTAADSRVRRLAARQHQRDHSHVSLPRRRLPTHRSGSAGVSPPAIGSVGYP